MLSAKYVRNLGKIYGAVFEKIGFENLGGAALLGFRPLAAPPGGNFLRRSIEVDEL